MRAVAPCVIRSVILILSRFFICATAGDGVCDPVCIDDQAGSAAHAATAARAAGLRHPQGTTISTRTRARVSL